MLVQLKQTEPVLSPPALNIYPLQELLYECDDLRQVFLVEVLIGRVFEYDTEEERITRETSGRLCKVAVELKLARFRKTFRFLKQTQSDSEDQKPYT